MQEKREQTMSRPYDTLTDDERTFVDDCIRLIYEEQKANRRVNKTLNAPEKYQAPDLAGDDRCERFADALATWIIESRIETIIMLPPVIGRSTSTSDLGIPKMDAQP